MQPRRPQIEAIARAYLGTARQAGQAAFQRLSPMLKDYICAFWTDWTARMSGGASVPFAIAAIFVTSWAQALCIVAAVCFAFLASYQVWKTQRLRADEFAEKLRPKLKCSFSMSDPDCVLRGVKITTVPGGVGQGTSLLPTMGFVPTTTSTPAIGTAIVNYPAVEVDYFRLKVETDRIATVSNCRGYLSWVRRGNQQVLGQIDLPFARSEDSDALKKQIHEGVPAHLDVLRISTENKVGITSPGHLSPSHINFDKIFEVPGEYLLRVAVASEGVPVHCDVLFSWTGDRRTAKITSRMVEGPIEA